MAQSRRPQHRSRARGAAADRARSVAAGCGVEAVRWPSAPDWARAVDSEAVLQRAHRGHVQVAVSGPELLVIHGAGCATQSWRGLFPLLTPRFRVIAVDLPGQGFSQSGAQRRFGLEAMAEDLLALTHHMGWTPRHIVGHSAGAAIALQMVAFGLRPDRVTGLNAALSNFKGVAGWLFPVLARALAVTPLSANLFAASATPATVHNLIKGTGSTLDQAGEALYLALCQDTAHVDGTLSMMAQWSLEGLMQRLPEIAVPVHLITGLNDRAVPPATSDAAAALLPQARVTTLPGLGHLAHEEDPATIAALI